MNSNRKKLIQVALPLAEINDASAYDKMPGIGAHPKGIHHWWARLPVPVSRAVPFASVVDDPSSHPEKFSTDEAQETERNRLYGVLGGDINGAVATVMRVLLRKTLDRRGL
jgi:putative DNA methylase